MTRAFNFNPGPAMLPDEVLLLAREQLLEWNDAGLSMMEMSHRSPEFKSITERIDSDLRKLLSIPKEYKLLFLHGGARSQFSMVPLNLLKRKTKADYIQTGVWSKLAVEEARRYCDVNLAAESVNYAPKQEEWRLSEDAAYVHYTPNETIAGVEFHWEPEINAVPLVADMTSNIASRPININKFGIIYAAAQKNIGIAGITLVIIREDLAGDALPLTPSMFNYQEHIDSGSMCNTPPVFNWYMSGLMIEWMLRQGGIESIEAKNIRNADKLYNTIDQSDFYINDIAKDSRSRMNVPFTLKDPSLDQRFLAEAQKAGLIGLKGHQLAGGMRASIYNAMPEEGVDRLVEFMSDFSRLV